MYRGDLIRVYERERVHGGVEEVGKQVCKCGMSNDVPAGVKNILKKECGV